MGRGGSSTPQADTKRARHELLAENIGVAARALDPDLHANTKVRRHGVDACRAHGPKAPARHGDLDPAQIGKRRAVRDPVVPAETGARGPAAGSSYWPTWEPERYLGMTSVWTAAMAGRPDAGARARHCERSARLCTKTYRDPGSTQQRIVRVL